MSFLKNLFKKKVVPVIEDPVGFEDDSHEKCGLCKFSVFPNTPAKTFPKSGVDRKRYHIKCWRRLRKLGDAYQKTGKVVEQ